MPTRKDGEESRIEERLPVSLNASVNNSECLTRDISASGVYLESGATFILGERVDFAFELKSPGGQLVIKCNGEVIRVDKLNGKVGVAIKILESDLKSA